MHLTVHRHLDILPVVEHMKKKNQRSTLHPTPIIYEKNASLQFQVYPLESNSVKSVFCSCWTNHDFISVLNYIDLTSDVLMIDHCCQLTWWQFVLISLLWNSHNIRALLGSSRFPFIRRTFWLSKFKCPIHVKAFKSCKI